MAHSKLAIVIAFCSAFGFASSFADAQKIYWTSNGIGDHKIVRSDLDGSNIEEFLTQVGPIALTIDPVNGKLYWTGSNDVTFFLGVQRINLDGTNAEELVSRDFDQIQYGIALDLTGGKMYWTQADFASLLGEIRRANLDGSNVQVLLTGLDDPYGIALDLGAGKMYWTEEGAGRIRRADLSGSNIEDLVTGLDGPRGIALDVRGGKMYWSDVVSFGVGRIMRSALDGSIVEELFAELGGFVFAGIALDLDARKMYITDGEVVRSNLDGTAQEVVLDGSAQALPGIALDLRGPIPAASAWGLVLLTLFLLTAATLILLRRPSARKV